MFLHHHHLLVKVQSLQMEKLMRYMHFQDQAFFEMADLVGLPMFSEEQRRPLDILTTSR
jgi:glycerate kinase